MKIGLTGGMGCGKSTVLAIFERLGLETIETDQLVKDLLREDPLVLQSIQREFGSKVFDEKGRIDRKRLGGIVFESSKSLEILEGILHPRVREIWTNAINKADSDLVVEIPLLFEKNLESQFDLTICIACSPDIQKERLIKRGFNPEQIESRLNRQLPIEDKVNRADVVIYNDGSEAHLNEQIHLFLKTISK